MRAAPHPITTTVRYDLHVHTNASRDALNTLEGIIRWVQRRGLDGVAITDHNNIDNALRLAERAPFPVIVGEEIRTTRGEIIGLFLREWIPPDLSPDETVHRIHDQGAIAYVPHPLDRSRDSAMGERALLEIIDRIDAAEGLNARVLREEDNTRAQILSREHDLPLGAGSDAHMGFEIGRAYVELPPFSDASGFLASLRQGTLHGHLSSPLVHLGSAVAKLTHRFASAEPSSPRSPSRSPHE